MLASWQTPYEFAFRHENSSHSLTSALITISPHERVEGEMIGRTFIPGLGI